MPPEQWYVRGSESLNRHCRLDFRASPPRWWSCDHVSLRAHMVHVQKSLCATVIWHIVGFFNVFRHSQLTYCGLCGVVRHGQMTFMWALWGCPPRSADIFVVFISLRPYNSPIKIILFCHHGTSWGLHGGYMRHLLANLPLVFYLLLSKPKVLNNIIVPDGKVGTRWVGVIILQVHR